MRPIKETRLGQIDSYNDIVIFEGFPYFFYEVQKPKFSKEELDLAEKLKRFIIGKKVEMEPSEKGQVPQGVVDYLNRKFLQSLALSEANSKLLIPEKFFAFSSELANALKPVGFVKDALKFAAYVLDASIGFGYLAPLMRDESLEEIMVNGEKRVVFVFHKKYGMCKTNLSLDERNYMPNLVQRIANTVGRRFDSNHPLLDARLPDGSRANATESLVTPNGVTLTIRKFTKIPLSIVDLIANNTLTSEVAAFLWVAIEGMNIQPMSLIVTGGSGTGKTTTLNVLASFIRFQDRIVTIEDTLELDLGGRENWIQMESKPALRESHEVSMDDLLRNALRMRPDRIIVGEVRGPEAQTLFVAMDTGHEGCMGTLHANSAKEMFLRLKADPMGVPEQMLPLLDLVLVQYKMYIKGKGILRRVTQISEVSAMENQALVANVFEWNREKDELERTNTPSHIIETLGEKVGRSKKDVMREINIRRTILEWLLKQGIRRNPDVETVIQRYYYEPQTVLEEVSKALE
ncbi:MAG: ATPase, T2SS/T4P/T4SS family [Candidatus Diapherotrites archaeon]